MKEHLTDRIYLDHAAATPISDGVRDAMLPWLEGEFGNASSMYREGRRAKAAIDGAREVLSAELGCLFAEALFTSSGTEAANLAVLGLALNQLHGSRKKVLMGAAEHHCVLNTAPILADLGYQVELIPVDREARLDLNALMDLLGDDVLLCCTMHANNEFGTINSIRDIGSLCHGFGTLLYVDSVQTFHAPGLSWKVAELDADIVTVSGHKIYGPKGVGAIYIRAGVKLKPLAVGGGQEREMRAGTENVAAIVGFGAAISLPAPRAFPISSARDHFVGLLRELGVVLTVQTWENVLAGHAHVRLPGVDAETMLIALDRLGVSASSGAACSSGSVEPSHVMLACGYSAAEAREGLRFTFGRDATEEVAREAASRVSAALRQINLGARASRPLEP